MSTIPTTFNERRIPYTVLGGPQPRAEALSALVLNRGGRQFGHDVFDSLEKAKFSSIVSIEGGGEGKDIESIANRHPRLRFVLVRDRISPGEAVNIGLQESPGDFVLVLWSDMHPSVPPAGKSLLERLRERAGACAQPAFSGPDNALLPSRVVPAYHGRRALKLLSLVPEKEGEACLMPYDYCGFYRRESFMLIGGYDHTIANPWWQKADFGFRAFLRGERIRFDPGLRLSYSSLPVPEDATNDSHYARFFLKNLAPRFSGDSASLPYSLFLSFAARSGLGFARSLEEFKLAREWVGKNKYLFRTDSSGITDLWETFKP